MGITYQLGDTRCCKPKCFLTTHTEQYLLLVLGFKHGYPLVTNTILVVR